MLRLAFAIVWLFSCGLALAAPESSLGQITKHRYDRLLSRRSATAAEASGGPVPGGQGICSGGACGMFEVPLRPDNGLWLATVDVGDSRNLALQIDTTSSYLMILPPLYNASHEAVELDKFGMVPELLHKGYSCGSSHYWNYSLFTDVVSVQGRTIAKQTVVNDTAPDFDFDPSTTTFDGILGLSGTGGYSSLFGTPSFLDNFFNQLNFDQRRFGVALNSTTPFAYNDTDSTGTLLLGGVKKTLIDGGLVKVPVDKTRKERTVSYVGNIGQWWLRGDVEVRGSTKKSRILHHQSLYFDVAMDHIEGPRAQVRDLFEEMGLRIVEDNVDCGHPLTGFFNCSSPPPEVSFRFGGSTGGAISLPTSSINWGDVSANDNGTCVAAIFGYDMGEEPYWSLGYPFFRGKYVDFNGDDNTVGFGYLKDGALPVKDAKAKG